MKTDWEAISNLLEKTHGNPRHGNPTDPLDCLIYLMLTRKTPIITGQKIYNNLKAILSKWDDLLDFSREQLVSILSGSGLESIRADNIKEVIRKIKDQYEEVSLEPLREKDNNECLKFLSSLPGVGMKTSLCVMMYTLGRNVFPADAHCIRVLKRIGIIPYNMQHRPAQKLLLNLVPPKFSYKLHVNLVAHGQKICTARAPVCFSCTIAFHCNNKALNS